MCEYDEGPQKEFDQTKIHIGQAKSELGANRGPRAGSPRGVVEATSQKPYGNSGVAAAIVGATDAFGRGGLVALGRGGGGGSSSTTVRVGDGEGF